MNDLSDQNQKFDAVILAAGSGSRYTKSGGLTLKQVEIYRGLPIIRRLYDQLLEIDEVDKIFVVISDNVKHQKIIRKSLPNIGPEFIVNKESQRDKNLLSFLLAAEKLRSNAIILESDCVVESIDIKNMLAATGVDEICFANLGYLANGQYGGVVELNQIRNVIAIHVLTAKELLEFQRKQKLGLKLFGMTAFGENVLQQYTTSSHLIDSRFDKYFLEVAITKPEVFLLKTVRMTKTSFSFNTTSEFIYE